MRHHIFRVREFIKTGSATAVQRAFRIRFNIQPPTRKSICRWNHQFQQIGCLCKGKISDRPRVSEENVRRIKVSFERSPRKLHRRASRKLAIPQPTVWRVLRRRLLFKPHRLQLVQALWVHLFQSPCIISFNIDNHKTTRSRWKHRIGTTTNVLILYIFPSLYIFVTWRWPTVVETCRQHNK